MGLFSRFLAQLDPGPGSAPRHLAPQRARDMRMIAIIIPITPET
jgi:hypothetical protein